jgi:hypothetical protein
MERLYSLVRERSRPVSLLARLFLSFCPLRSLRAAGLLDPRRQRRHQ